MKDIDRMPANGGPACLDGNVTVRDYFAAQAMAALVPTYDDPNAVARMAYAHADAIGARSSARCQGVRRRSPGAAEQLRAHRGIEGQGVGHR
jgi:hypothetical protein